ncbi:hypothetical protein [Pseudidiomarina aestuarii]|uniref:hypothetical protein n=1 Tax=Pseudidiomarina aestuarii TaxID=624146 RepID=UPI003A9751C5
MNKQQIEKWQVVVAAVEQLQSLNITVCNVFMSSKAPIITIEPPASIPLVAPFSEVAFRRGGELVRIRTGIFQGCAVRWLSERNPNPSVLTH